jgi:hypothetical protein
MVDERPFTVVAVLLAVRLLLLLLLLLPFDP